ncbi:MAG: hypothetical protein ACR2NP_06965 [Pirellulaceae bacterium]
MNRFGARLPLIAGPLITAVGLLLFARPGVGGSYWTTYFPAVVVMGLGMAISVAPLTTTVMGSVGERRAGLASGVNNAVSRVAAVLAIAIFGPVVLGTFANSLDSRLENLDLPEEQRVLLLEQSVNLGAAEIPASFDADLTARLNVVFNEAFIDGYRIVLYVTAVLAVLAALTAAVFIQDEKTPAVEGTMQSAEAA